MSEILPTDYECPQCDEDMEEEDEGKFWCENCGVGLQFYEEDGELYADEY